jgi:hypothetical protein
MKGVTESDIRLLYALHFELPSIRTKLHLARLIGEFPDKKTSKNPVLNFVFDHATTAIIEWLLLRIAEAITILNRASEHFLGQPLVVRHGRKKTSPIPEFERALELRDVRVAHRLANQARTGTALPASIVAQGGIYAFLEGLLNCVAEALERLDGAGLYDGMDDFSASATAPLEFSTEDVKALIEAANRLPLPPIAEYMAGR